MFLLLLLLLLSAWAGVRSRTMQMRLVERSRPPRLCRMSLASGEAAGSWAVGVRRKVREAGVSVRRWRVRAGLRRRDIFEVFELFVVCV